MRAQVAIALVALAALALGLATVWPALARVEAMAAMLALPVLAVVAALRQSLLDGRWLPVGVFTVGAASALLALVVAVTTLFPGEPLATVRLGPGAPEQTVTAASDASEVTLTVRGPALGADRPLRLGIGRGDQEREVHVVLVAPGGAARSFLEMGAPIVERQVSTDVPGKGLLHVRWLGPVDESGLRIELDVRATSFAARHALPLGASLAAVGIILQVLAERRRCRSWLLLGSWCAIGFAVWVPGGWDPSQPAGSAFGALLFAALAGGGGAAVVSYVIARQRAVPELR